MSRLLMILILSIASYAQAQSGLSPMNPIVDFGSVLSGSTGYQNFVLTNSGNIQSFQPVSLPNPFSLVLNRCVSVRKNKQCAVTIQARTKGMAPGDYSFNLPVSATSNVELKVKITVPFTPAPTPTPVGYSFISFKEDQLEAFLLPSERSKLIEVKVLNSYQATKSVSLESSSLRILTLLNRCTAVKKNSECSIYIQVPRSVSSEVLRLVSEGSVKDSINLVVNSASAASPTPTPAPTPTLAQRADAATTTANSSLSCSSLGGFYWEIGDKNSSLVSGQTSGSSWGPNTSMQIASGSKWIFGAYVAEVRSSVLSPADIKGLTMTSGNFMDDVGCLFAYTVGQCANYGGLISRPQYSDMFIYDSGHMQKLALDMGLTSLNTTQLSTTVSNTLALSVGYSTLQLAGGSSMSSSEYAKFLRKLMNNQLALGPLLGSNAVCTDCHLNVYTPPFAGIHYSLGHWVEDGPSGDGSFSSVGLFGFYPWIDSTKTYYGVIGRANLSDLSGAAGNNSLACGNKIRRAFMSGSAQP